MPSASSTAARRRSEGMSPRVTAVLFTLVNSGQAGRSAAWSERRRQTRRERMNRTGRPCTDQDNRPRFRKALRKDRPGSTTGIADNRCWSPSGSRRPPESSASSSSNSGKREAREGGPNQAGSASLPVFADNSRLHRNRVGLTASGVWLAPFGAKKPYTAGCDVQMKPWFFFNTARGFFPSRARIKGYSWESFTTAGSRCAA